MDTRILTTFPTPGHPSPRIISPSTLRTFPVRHPPGTRPPTATTRLNRWFCCKCAEKGYQDPIGMVNHSDSASATESCWRPPCNHTKCHNCLASPTHSVHDAIRTFGGLHTSPAFIDPVFWECPCGEWAKNPFGEAHSVMGITVCASQTCDFRYRSPLRGDSVVMNVYGQRLGTADQTVAVMGGPWYWQRRGLSDGGNVIVDAFRRQQQRRAHGELTGVGTGGVGGGGQRMLPPMVAGSQSLTWPENQPVPRYPYRPPPPSSNSDGGEVVEGLRLAYRMAYLAGVASEAVGGGEGDGVVSVTGESEAGKGVVISSGRSHLNSTNASVGRFPGSVGVADHVQIQMQMRVQSQTSREVLPRWM